MQLFSRNSHICEQGVKRLYKVYEILNKENLLKDLKIDDGCAQFFAFQSDQGKGTFWSVWLYRRQRMNDEINKQKTKRSIISNVKNRAKLGNSTSDFNALFKTCAEFISDYTDKRNHWYLKISKDRIIFLEKLMYLVEMISDKEGIEDKIFLYSKLIRALNNLRKKPGQTIQDNDIWDGRNLSQTSINHVLDKVCSEISFGVIGYFVIYKTPATGKILEKFSNEILNFTKILKSCVENNFKFDENKSFFNELDILSHSKKCFERLELSQISRDAYYKNSGLNKPIKNLFNERIYFMLEVKISDGHASSKFFLKCDIPEIYSNKISVEEKKNIVLYKANMIINYSACKLFYYPNSIYLISICDSAFNSAIKLNHPFSTQLESLSPSKNLSKASKIVNSTNVYPLSLNPFETNNFARSESISTYPSSLNPFELNENKSKCKNDKRVIDIFKNIFSNKKHKKLPEEKSSLSAIKSHHSPLVRNDMSFIQFIEIQSINIKSYVKIDKDGVYKENLKFDEENKKINLIYCYNDWKKNLENYKNLHFNKLELSKNNSNKHFESDFNSINKSMSELILNIEKYQNILETDRFKALARYVFSTIEDNDEAKKRYNWWILQSKNIDSKFIKDVWESLCLTVIFSKINFDQETKKSISENLKKL